jgi:hypothetical protein
MSKHKVRHAQKDISVFFTSFYPLCCMAQGIKAIENYNLPPFIDGSCLREPDFQHDYPAITGLCRPGFVDRLNIDDLIIYTTNKKLLGSKMLIAVLKVLEIEADHTKAFNWYESKNAIPPNNIMVPGNFVIPLEKTHGIGPWIGWGWTKEDIDEDREESLEAWGRSYEKRALESPKVAICEVFNGIKNLNKPYELRDSSVGQIFGRYLGTQTPPSMTQDEWNRFIYWLRDNTEYQV